MAGLAGGDPGAGQPKEEGRPGGDGDVVDGDAGRTRQSLAGALNYRSISFENSNLRSRYNETLRTIEINTIHPDYHRARQQDGRVFLVYLVVLVAKELALLNYQGVDPAELMEKYAELLRRVQLHLPRRA
jgi:hypothetical protein